jgi:hypothetical protein
MKPFEQFEAEILADIERLDSANDEFEKTVEWVKGIKALSESE